MHYGDVLIVSIKIMRIAMFVDTGTGQEVSQQVAKRILRAEEFPNLKHCHDNIMGTLFTPNLLLFGPSHARHVFLNLT